MMTELETRVKLLENANRRCRWTMVGMAVLMVGIVAGGAGRDDDVQGLVRARRIEVVDESGAAKVVLSVGAGPTAGGHVGVYPGEPKQKGQPTFVTVVTAGLLEITKHDAEKRHAPSLFLRGTPETGGGYLGITRPDSKGAITLQCIEDGGLLDVYNAKGKVVVKATADGRNCGAVIVCDETGQGSDILTGQK